MCWQGHNLSSTQVSAFIHDLVLLQPVIPNAFFVGANSSYILFCSSHMLWGAWIHSVENRGGVARLNLLNLA